MPNMVSFPSHDPDTDAWGFTLGVGDTYQCTTSAAPNWLTLAHIAEPETEDLGFSEHELFMGWVAASDCAANPYDSTADFVEVQSVNVIEEIQEALHTTSESFVLYEPCVLLESGES